MFSRFICLNYMKKGKCEDLACKLQHVADIGTLEKGSKKTVASDMSGASATGGDDWEKIVIKPKAANGKKTNGGSSSTVVEPIKEERKRPVTAVASSEEASSASSSFITGGSRLKGKQALEEKKKKKEEEEKMKVKATKCKFLFEKGACRMGDKCFYSHEGYDPFVIAAAFAAASMRGRGRGGMRGGRGMPPGTAVMSIRGDERMIMPRFERHSMPVEESESRGFFAPTKSESKMITLKAKSHYEDTDIGDLDQQVRRIYTDLIRLEPVRRRMNAGKSLDMMFIIDCTGSMGSWIEACKKEIRSIIDCVRN
jgi:hypothetical protein